MHCVLGCIKLFLCCLAVCVGLSCFDFHEHPCSFYVFFLKICFALFVIETLWAILWKTRDFLQHLCGCGTYKVVVWSYSIFCYFMHLGDIFSGSLQQDDPVLKWKLTFNFDSCYKCCFSTYILLYLPSTLLVNLFSRLFDELYSQSYLHHLLFWYLNYFKIWFRIIGILASFEVNFL